MAVYVNLESVNQYLTSSYIVVPKEFHEGNTKVSTVS